MEQKDRTHYRDSKTNKSTYPYIFKTIEAIEVQPDLCRGLMKHQEWAMKEVQDMLKERKYKEGNYDVRIVLGGCKRFKKENGFRRVGVIEI